MQDEIWQQSMLPALNSEKKMTGLDAGRLEFKAPTQTFGYRIWRPVSAYVAV